MRKCRKRIERPYPLKMIKKKKAIDIIIEDEYTEINLKKDRIGPEPDANL